MGHKDLGVRNYNPSLAAQQTKAGKAYLAKIRKLDPYERLLYWIKERHAVHTRRFPRGLADSYIIFHDDIQDRDFDPRTASNHFLEASLTSPKENPKPWTDDPILQTVFFCNPYRENDKVTTYLREHFRKEYKDKPCVFLGTILLRWYNFIPTMYRLIKANIPQRFGSKKLTNGKGWPIQAYEKLLLPLRDEAGEQLFGGAYIIRPIVDGKLGARKVESIGQLMTRMAQDKWLYHEVCGNGTYGPRGPLQLSEGSMVRLGSTTTDCTPGTMAYAFARLRQFSGMGKFYNYQFIGDLAFTHILRDAPDWFDWGFCGPGTSRALVRLKTPSGKQATLANGKRLPRLMPLQSGWREQLLELHKQLNKDLGLAKPSTKIKPTSRTHSPPASSRSKSTRGTSTVTLGTVGDAIKLGGEVRTMQYIHMRDLCNCLCEYDKYDRALFNERSIKRPYYGRGESQ